MVFFPLCLSVCFHMTFLQDISHWCPFDISTMIQSYPSTSAKTCFLSKSTLWGFEWTWILVGTLVNPVVFILCPHKFMAFPFEKCIHINPTFPSLNFPASNLQPKSYLSIHSKRSKFCHLNRGMHETLRWSILNKTALHLWICKTRKEVIWFQNIMA